VYYESRRDLAEDLALMRLIDEIHLKWPFLGRHRIVDELADREVPVLVNHKLVQRLMRLMGITAVYRKPRTSMPGEGGEHRIFPYLLAGVEISRPQQVWCTDITFSAPRTRFSEVRVSGMHWKEVIGLPCLPLWGGLSRSGGDPLSTGGVT